MARRARLAAVHAQVDAEELRHVLADGHQRVQGRGGVLRDEPDVAAADLGHLALGQLQQVLALEDDLAAGDLALPGSIRRIDIAVAVLPDPLSPTSASVSPWRSENDTSRTARTSPRRVIERGVEVTDRQDGRPVLGQRRGGGWDRDGHAMVRCLGRGT